MTDDKIKLFTFNDESLKILGELLSNETSRKIINSLIENEMYTNELSVKLDIPISLVAHHLRKLEQVNLVEVTEKPLVKKGIKHKHFRMIPNLFVGSSPSENIQESESLKRIFKKTVKFAGIGIASFFVWATSLIENKIDAEPIEPQFYEKSDFILLLIIFGLLILFTINKKRK